MARYPRRSLPAAEDPNNKAFWDEFMRRPDAKAAYQAEQRLREKKKAWLQQRQEIDERAKLRVRVADALEDAPTELKKLIAPMFHIRIVAQFLGDIYEECVRTKRSFHERLMDPETMGHLRKFRENFQEGGEARMQDLEDEWNAHTKAMNELEEKKREVVPQVCDINTLKQLLEYAQECKREGNLKFREGLYEEALEIYSQADDAMKKWKVSQNMKNEHKWLTDFHLACLKNKSQAALKLELFQTALEAADSALKLDIEDHKAWYRKLQAQKGLGKFKEAEESLLRVEDIAQWCPDRRRILRDCDTERKRLKWAAIKHKTGTKEMLGKALEAGIFGGERERELEDARRQLEDAEEAARSLQDAPPRLGAAPAPKSKAAAKKEATLKPLEEMKPLKRDIHLTAALAGELIDELAESYKAKWFQDRVRKCARDSGYERSIFLMRLQDIAFKVQKPILVKWGFEGTEHGVREMTAAIKEHAGSDGKAMPDWLRRKYLRCLELLYGGQEGGMLDILSLA
mmetsp:Transcript_20068/g.46750  ORF Transcript_20068/g.46750 Transcript_20068/m.46750 type:complete len:515 (-) Transcript_20068:88-1632(-)